MNTKILVSALLVVITVTGCTNGIGRTEISLKSKSDSAIYFLGYNYGKQLNTYGIDVAGFNKEALLAGLNAGYAGTLNLTPEQEQQIGMLVRTFVQEAQEKKNDAALIEGERFMVSNAKRSGVQALSEGVQYKVLKEGKGPKPTVDDKVRVSYTGRLVDGKEFDSSANMDGGYMEFPVAGVIPGWVVALQAMPVGSKWEVYIPANMAYGRQGYGPIPGNSVLIFEMELLDIISKEAVR